MDSLGLLSPFDLRGLRIRNRLVMPPMATGLAGPDGEARPAHVEHYRVRAEAGVGLIILEHTFVHPDGRLGNGQLGLHHDGLVQGLREVVRAIKGAGAVAAVQLNHCGSAAEPLPGRSPLGPSPIPHPSRGVLPRELTTSEIERIRDCFAAAAKRAVSAGFDAIEIHGAHGYLLGQFLSPLTNRREDRYGGDAEGRMRFPLEVVRAVRSAVGPDVPLLYRLGAWDGMKGGLTLGDVLPAARALVDAGVDVLDVSGGFCGSSPEFLQGVQGYFVPLAASLRKETPAPVICTGGITEPEFADRLVRYERADLVGVGRPQLEDPRWAEKCLRTIMGGS
ncbi:MAG: NADH:flavin oxidoreductase [Firmicutes bacterium]|jgi:2,4-dienoyl-CoA reductase-like NADH-dependent reductase (Old Yellow Enzyme family)|nr:NADH:flavin oxidoreductase [Bacillota bacterium]